MNRRNFVKTLIAPAFILPLTGAGERSAGEGSLYVISDHPERYVPLLLDELRRLGLSKTKEPSLRSARIQESQLPSFTATLNDRVIDFRRPELASLWRRMQQEDPSSRLTIVDLGRPRGLAKHGAEVMVKVDGKIIDGVPLGGGASRIYHLPGGLITVRIAEGAARVVSSSCAQKICLSSPPISSAGERIICAPHRFIMEIPGRKAWDTTTG